MTSTDTRKLLLLLFVVMFLAASRGVLARTASDRTAAFLSPTFDRHFPASTKNIIWLLSSANENDSNNDENSVKPTWTYTPYDPKKPTTRPIRRPFSTWVVPKKLEIPEDKLDVSFVRSSGAGGQNVNKVSTKVEIRLHVMDAHWIPLEVRQRLQDQQANRINKEGVLSLSSQEHRTQVQNRKAVVSKLESLLLEAYPRPKIRKQRKGVSKASKARTKEDKKRRSDLKSSRRSSVDGW
jgi:protein subunit release factor B